MSAGYDICNHTGSTIATRVDTRTKRVCSVSRKINERRDRVSLAPPSTETRVVSDGIQNGKYPYNRAQKISPQAVVTDQGHENTSDWLGV